MEEKEGTDILDRTEDDGNVPEVETSSILGQNDGILENEVGLKRQIGLFGSVAYLVGSIIGSGIFAAPRLVALYSGSSGVMLITWVASGVIAIMGGLTWCELALTFPHLSASEYSYIHEAYGSVPGFLVTWLLLLTKSASNSIISLVAGDYLSTAIYGEGDAAFSKGIAAGIIGINTFINCFSVNLGKRTQIVFTATKMIAIVMIIITGFVRLGQGHTENFKDAFNNRSADSASDIAFALYGGLYAYGGWYSLSFMTTEIINPGRTYPLAIVIGVPLVIFCYVLVNIAYLTVKSPEEIAVSSAIAVIIAKELHGVMHWVIPVLVAFSCFSTANAGNFFIGRFVYEAANRKHIPKFFGSVHLKRHTPIPAIMLTSLISCIILIPKASNFRSLLEYVQFLGWSKLSLAIFGLILMRKTRPNLNRPFKVFIGIPILLWIFSIFVVIAPFIRYPVKQAYGLIFLLFPLTLYIAFIRYQIIPKKVVDKIDQWTKKIHLLTNLGYPDFEKVTTQKEVT